MKTIYDLTHGDVYYTKGISFHCSDQTVKITPSWCKIQEEDDDDKFNTSWQSYEARLLHGEVWLTEEECQKSIDYDVAMAKIQKFVSEFSDEPDTMSEIIFNSHPQEIGFYISERNGYITQSSPLVFKTKNALRVLEELPEECKIVLGVE